MATDIDRRVRSLILEADTFCPHCRFNLVGTVAAGIERCPECGHGFDIWNLAPERRLRRWPDKLEKLCMAVPAAAMAATAHPKLPPELVWWMAFAFGPAFCYLWGCWVFRRRGVPGWAGFAVPWAAVFWLANALAGWAMIVFLTLVAWDPEPKSPLRFFTIVSAFGMPLALGLRTWNKVPYSIMNWGGGLDEWAAGQTVSPRRSRKGPERLTVHNRDNTSHWAVA